MRDLRRARTTSLADAQRAKLQRVCDQLQLAASRPRARDRLRVGRLRVARRAHDRLPRHRVDDLRRAGGARPRADRGRGSRRPDRDPRAGLPRCTTAATRRSASIEMLEAIGEQQFGTLLRHDRPRARAARHRLRPDDPDPRRPLGPLPQGARLDRAVRLPGLPDPVTDGVDARGDRVVAPDDARRARDRPALRRDAATLAREHPRAHRRGSRARLRPTSSSARGTSISRSARPVSGRALCATFRSRCRDR